MHCFQQIPLQDKEKLSYLLFPCQVQNHLVRYMEINISIFSRGTWLKSEVRLACLWASLLSEPWDSHQVGLWTCRSHTLHQAHCLMLNGAERGESDQISSVSNPGSSQ